MRSRYPLATDVPSPSESSNSSGAVAGDGSNNKKDYDSCAEDEKYNRWKRRRRRQQQRFKSVLNSFTAMDLFYLLCSFVILLAILYNFGIISLFWEQSSTAIGGSDPTTTTTTILTEEKTLNDNSVVKESERNKDYSSLKKKKEEEKSKENGWVNWEEAGMEETLWTLVKAYVEHSLRQNIGLKELNEEISSLLGNMTVPFIMTRKMISRAGFHYRQEQQDRQRQSQRERKEEAKKDSSYDAYLQNLERIAHDPDCLGRPDSGEITVKSPADVARAAEILTKCKILVLRNALDPSYVENVVKKLVARYAMSFLSGRTPLYHNGRTTNGEHYFAAERGDNRWELLLPQDLVRSIADEVLTNDVIVGILENETLLGDSQLALHSAGVNFAAPGAVGQDWHFDEAYLFPSSRQAAGHDLPAYAITLSVPLLDLTPQHGPTEFCLGTSAIQGLRHIWQPNALSDLDDSRLNLAWLRKNIYNHSLLEPNSTFRKFTSTGPQGCHPDFWKAPTLRMGDVSFFDYQLSHRGGWNVSPETRAVLFLTYSRHWFKDINFAPPVPPSKTLTEQLGYQHAYIGQKAEDMMRQTRFAIPKGGKIVPCRNMTECEREVSTNLNDVKSLVAGREPYSSTVDDDEVLASAYLEDFLVSNKDIVLEASSHPHLFVNDEDKGTLGAGESMRVEGQLGDTFRLKSSSGGDEMTTIAEWPVHFRGQVMFTQEGSKVYLAKTKKEQGEPKKQQAADEEEEL